MNISFESKKVKVLRRGAPVWASFVISLVVSFVASLASLLMIPALAEARPISPALASEPSKPSIVAGDSGKSPLYISRADTSQKITQDKNLAKADVGRLNDVVEENKLLKEHREVLLQYTKELRDKYQKLQQFCLKSGDPACNKASNAVESQRESVRVTAEPQNLFKEELAALRSELEVTRLKRDDLQQELSKKIASLAELNKKQAEAQDTIAGLRSEIDQLNNNNKKLVDENARALTELNTSLERKESEAKECFMQLEKSQELVAKIPDFERDILALKNDLLLRKSAEEILMPVDASGAATRSDNNSSAKSSREVPRRAVKSEVSRQGYNDRPGIVPPAVSDVTIIEVTGKKVSLRAGPGTNNSSLMDIQAGARLLVEAKEGAWYRVTAPTGGRAYIHSSYVKIVQRGRGDHATAINPPEPRRPSLPVGGSQNQDTVNQQTRAADSSARPKMEDDMVPVNIPAKPVRRAGSPDSKDNLAPASKGIAVEINPNSTEALAIEKLMKAMENQSKGKN